MTGKERYDMRIQAAGGSTRGDLINTTRGMVDRLFGDDPSFRDDITFWDTGEPIRMRVYEHTQPAAGSAKRSIETPYDEPFGVGDVFVMGSDGCWLCFESFGAFETNNEGTVRYCNSSVTFKVGDIVYTYPMETMNATQYNSGETPRNQMTIGSAQHLCYLTCDDITVKINNGFRFIMDKNRENPTVYRLTQVDSQSYSYGEKGILQWTIVEDQYVEGKDDPITGVCPSQQELDKNPSVEDAGSTDGDADDGWL